MTPHTQSEEALVSVIIPAYNAAPWVNYAVASVLAQTWRKLEVIVVDDGSQDETIKVVKSTSDPRLSLICQNNRGAAAARNRGLAAAKGTFIQFLDADDLISAEKIGRQMDALQLAPLGSIASSSWGRFVTDPQNVVIQPESVWAVSDPVAWLIESFGGAGMMQPGAWLTPRAVIEAAGPWDEALSLHDDGEFFTRVLLKATQNVFVPGVTVFYRDVPGSLSRRRSRRAVESALAVCRSQHRHLLAASDTEASRRAVATQYAQFAYEFTATAPNLAREALQTIQDLGAAPIPVIGGTVFRWLSRWFGMASALNIRDFLGRASRPAAGLE